MGTIPPSNEWKPVDRGKSNARPGRPLVNRKTLMFAFKMLSLLDRLFTAIHDLFDDV